MGGLVVVTSITHPVTKAEMLPSRSVISALRRSSAPDNERANQLAIRRCIRVAAVLLGTGALAVGMARPDAAATAPPATPAVDAIVSAVLRKGVRSLFVESEPISDRYSLVRLQSDPYHDSVNGRFRFLLRITIRNDTREPLEVHGEYAENEADLINARLPAGCITADHALKVAADALHRSELTDVAEPSRADIDLVAGQFFVIRIANKLQKVPRQPGVLTPDYALTYIIEAKSGKILQALTYPA